MAKYYTMANLKTYGKFGKVLRTMETYSGNVNTNTNNLYIDLLVSQGKYTESLLHPTWSQSYMSSFVSPSQEEERYPYIFLYVLLFISLGERIIFITIYGQHSKDRAGRNKIVRR